MALALILVAGFSLWILTLGRVVMVFAGYEIVANPLVAMLLFCGVAWVLERIYRIVFAIISGLIGKEKKA